MMQTDTQPRYRDEPVSMADALKEAFGTPDRETYIAEHDAKHAANPDAYFKLGVCRFCACELPAKVIPMGPFGFLPNVCCDACADKGIKEMAANERKAQDARFASIVPAEFLNWDDERGNRALMAKVNGAFSFTDRRGLVIHGQSGSCKTRVMWQLVKRIAAQPENYSWAFLDAYEAATKGIPADAERASFLFLDDLGNEPTSTKWETSLLHLIRRRNDWHRPVFMTTQLTGEQFKGRYFSGAAAVAILRRLRERATIINSDKP